MSKENSPVKKNLSVIVKLSYPLEWAGAEGVKKEITEVEFRRPKGKDIKGMGRDVSLEDILKIAARVSDYSPRFFDELDGIDCMKISEVINDFLDDGQATGKTN
jgi:hypothetical protein